METINRIVAIQEIVQNPGKVLYSAEYTMLFCRRVPVRFSAEGMFEYEYYGDWVRMAGSNYLSEFQRVPQRDTNFG